MQTKLDSFIDLGDLGQPACEVTGDVTEDDYTPIGPGHYDVENLTITVPALGNLDVTQMAVAQLKDQFEQELIDTYISAKHAANVGRGVESYYAGRASRLSSLLGVA